MATETMPQPPVAATDEMPLLGIDHVELYVGNAKQAAFWFSHALGFTVTAYAGLETGVRDRASFVLEQGRVRFVLTAPLLGTSEIARHVGAHGDGVKVIGLSVPDAEHAYRYAVQHGARGVREPWEESDEEGSVKLATIATYGETLHTFVERDGYTGPFLPGFATRAVDEAERSELFVGIDHVVGNVELGRLDEWVGYYERVFGMTEMIHFTDRDIGTEYSALMSKVMADGKGRVKFPINEPAEGKRKSQIEEYLEYYGGPGAQHIALATTDIVATVRELRDRGVSFLSTPESYYAELPERIGEIDEKLSDLRELGILADRDDEGYLLQIFTQTIGDRPTVFLEVIERHGAKGFGEGNFKALFEAIEREQERRGNLSMRYHSLGSVPKKRHTQFRTNGRLLVEEVMGYEGFSGNESILYHVQSPCRIAEAGEFTPIEHHEWVPDTHVHRHLESGQLKPGGDPITSRRCLMWNKDLEVSLCRPSEETEVFYRDGEGDEVFFVCEGSGTLETVFGSLPYREHDYVVIPRGTTYRFSLDETPQTWILLQTPGEIETPNRYRNRYGQLLESAPYSQRDFHPPLDLETHRDGGDHEVLVRVRGGLQRYVLDYHPFDVVGWDGYVYPYTFNVHDFEPRTGRLHLPPPVHQTFQGPNFVICSFCPRELDYDPEAVPIPYHHSNLQSEEVIYYVSGEFGSRRGIEVGSITVHPSGLPHGPQPGLVEKALGMRRTEELAVMWDTFAPLRLTELAAELDEPSYAYSWRDQAPSPVAESTTG